MKAILSPMEVPPPPSHVAIIMDGNGRWARTRGLPRIEGHRQGAEALRRVSDRTSPPSSVSSSA